MEAEEGSGNVFIDIGFPKKEAERLLHRSQLVVEIIKYVKKNKLTSEEELKCLGMEQVFIDKLFKGKINFIKIDKLESIVKLINIKKLS